MGFGFNLFFIFILIPLTIILLIAWLATKKNIYGKAVGFIWMGVVGLVMISLMIHATMAKKILKKEDFYGQYIVDRSYFRGKQTDWQYDNFRFEIKENDSIYLYVTNKDKIVKTFIGTVTTLKPYGSERLVVNMQQSRHHIFESNPTIYRSTWIFYLVFNSPRFGNMFFKKGQWSHR
ncbi:hypothetical protein [Pedobacter polysacchareus]|uniref:hypothetical protein n=1 Tax=Pedobacter polysacchareus TaxID=2861973 RepID=UPI001C99DE72|nr:hypothetical protein [Pedobacter polysacchareus]